VNNSTALGAIRNRWWIIAVLAVVGALLGALPAPDRVEEESVPTDFAATHTLLINDPDALNSTNELAIAPSQVTLLATAGEVPKRVAERIAFDGNSAELASQVTASFDFATGALTISTTQTSAARAEEVANAFADVLTAYLAERQDRVYQERLAASAVRLGELEAELDELTAELADQPGDVVLSAQRDAIARQYSVAFEQDEGLQAQPAFLGFTTLQSAEAVAQETRGGIAAPTSRRTRGALGLVVGAIVGFGIAMLMARLDRRIRSRDQVEALLDLRARVLVPFVRDDRRVGVVVHDGRHDALTDSYRTLRNVVSFVHGGLPPATGARTTVVVSPGPGEGKTSLSVNLAAAFAETGQRTVAINTDFRRPQLSNHLADRASFPLPFTLDAVDELPPQSLLVPSPIEHVEVLDLASLGTAGELARTTARLVPELVSYADAIVVDTSPVAATAEVQELIPTADVIVLVVRLNRTTIDTAERTIAIVRDLSTAPILLVVTGVKLDRSKYYEYAHRRPGPPPRPRRSLLGGRHRPELEPTDVIAPARSARSASAPEENPTRRRSTSAGTPRGS